MQRQQPIGASGKRGADSGTRRQPWGGEAVDTLPEFTDGFFILAVVGGLPLEDHHLARRQGHQAAALQNFRAVLQGQSHALHASAGGKPGGVRGGAKRGK